MEAAFLSFGVLDILLVFDASYNQRYLPGTSEITKERTILATFEMIFPPIPILFPDLESEYSYANLSPHVSKANKQKSFCRESTS